VLAVSSWVNGNSTPALTNVFQRIFVFIMVGFAFDDLSSLRTHSAFTEVMRKRREVTRKLGFRSFVLLSCLAFRRVLATA
jgi:hypothetical protein